MSSHVRAYGWVRQHPDFRDRRFKAAPAAPLPPKVDLRHGCPAVYDQLDIGSCTANAIAAAIQFDEHKQGKALPVMPSRLYIYYFERSLEGTVDSDAGAEIRDGIKVAAKGVCREIWWPYDTRKFTVHPSGFAVRHATERALVYESIDNRNLTEIKAAIAAGFPVVFGFTVYDSFEGEEVAKSGVVPMPTDQESVQGGHAVLAVGYDDADDGGRFLVRNSWGDSWGQSGYFTIPYAYLTNPDLASDFWVIRSVS